MIDKGQFEMRGLSENELHSEIGAGYVIKKAVHGRKNKIFYFVQRYNNNVAVSEIIYFFFSNIN